MRRRKSLRGAGLRLTLVAAFALAAACQKRPLPPTESESAPKEAAEPRAWLPWKPQPTPAATPPKAPAEIWNEFDGKRAMGHVKFQVDLGPRPSGSPALERLRQYLAGQLEAVGWQVERQTFTDSTPRGPVQFTNLIARFRPDPSSTAVADTQRVIIASHYDTKIFDTIQFVGASDGASSTGALIELARVLAMDWELAKRIELVFFDGEEAVSQFTATDGLYGSRHYAKVLRDSKRAAQFKYGILWDMIGDAELSITLSPDSPAQLARGILEAAQAHGVRNVFGYHAMPIWDDHVPLNQIRIPTIDLIDFDYVYWHTADDTLDKLSPKSLETVAGVTLRYLRQTGAGDRL